MSYAGWTDDQVEAELRRRADAHTDCTDLLVEWCRRILARAKTLLEP